MYLRKLLLLTTGKAKGILLEKKYFWRTLSKYLQKSEDVMIEKDKNLLDRKYTYSPTAS